MYNRLVAYLNEYKILFSISWFQKITFYLDGIDEIDR